MKSYNFKYHTLFSLISSSIVGLFSYLILKPSSFATVTGTLTSLDSNETYTSVAYGYSTIFMIILVSVFIMLALYRPTKKIIDKKFSETIL